MPLFFLDGYRLIYRGVVWLIVGTGVPDSPSVTFDLDGQMLPLPMPPSAERTVGTPVPTVVLQQSSKIEFYRNNISYKSPSFLNLVFIK